MGKHLHEVLSWPGPLTHRQYMVWQEWLNQQWNRPSRTDSYLMQVTCEMRRSYVKSPRKVKLKDFELKFRESGLTVEDGNNSVGDPTEEQMMKVRKVEQLRKLGGKAKLVTISPKEAIMLDSLPAEEAVRHRREIANQRGKDGP